MWGCLRNSLRTSMSPMARHKFPQNEVFAQAGGLKRAAKPLLRGLCALFTAAGLSHTALAQQTAENTATPKNLSAATLLPAPVSPTNSDFTLTIPETGSKHMLDLNLDFDSLGCLAGEQNCLRDEAPLDMGFSTSISKKGKKGLDLELVPSASMRFDDDSRSAVVGAVVRIGEDLRSKDVSSNTWYVFAGADAEALSYTPESASALTRGEFGLSDRIIIGDAQAGVGYRIGAADVSLGYFRREISTLNGSLGTEGFSKTEDAAALSFTWKR